MCESCGLHPAIVWRALLPGVEPFGVCAGCDYAALARERTSATPRRLTAPPLWGDTPTDHAHRRAVLAATAD